MAMRALRCIIKSECKPPHNAIVQTKLDTSIWACKSLTCFSQVKQAVVPSWTRVLFKPVRSTKVCSCSLWQLQPKCAPVTHDCLLLVSVKGDESTDEGLWTPVNLLTGYQRQGYFPTNFRSQLRGWGKRTHGLLLKSFCHHHPEGGGPPAAHWW